MKLGNIGMAVNHNSPYLLKRADGSFIDPETGERLGFDHRFMATGEGYQAHGWGSYFSENDRRHYADNQRQLNKYKGTTDIYKLHLKNADEWAVMHTLSDLELYPTLTVDEIIQKAINGYEAKITIDEEKLVLLNKIKNIGDDSVEYWKDKFEKFVLEDKIKTIVGDGNAAQGLCVDMGTCLTLDQYPYSKIISAYEKSLHNSCVDAEEMIAAYKRLNPADFERVVKERHHYEVEIPDNDGLIYIEEKKTLTDEQIQMVLDGLGRWQVIDVRTDKWLKPYTNSDGKPFSYERGGNWIGTTLYNWLCEAFDYEHKYRDMKPADAGRRASQFLHDCGFVGIHYSSYSDGECYVIFDEADAKIVNHELFGLSGDAPRFNIGDWIEYYPLAEEAKRGKYKGKLWVHNITAVGDTFYTVDSWCVQTRQPSRNRQLTIDGQQEWYRKIERPRWATATDGKAKRLRLAKAKAKAAIALLELVKLDGIEDFKERKALYHKLLNTSNYYDVDYNPTNGGLKAIHVGHRFDKDKGVYEKRVIEFGYQYGYCVILEDETDYEPSTTHTEGTWNGELFELAGCENAGTNNNNIVNGLKHCASKNGTKVAVLYFPKDKFAFEDVNRAIRRYYGLKNTIPYFKEFSAIYTIDESGIYRMR